MSNYGSVGVDGDTPIAQRGPHIQKGVRAVARNGSLVRTGTLPSHHDQAVREREEWG